MDFSLYRCGESGLQSPGDLTSIFCSTSVDSLAFRVSFVRILPPIFLLSGPVISDLSSTITSLSVPFIIEVLEKNKKDVTDIDEIEVNTGPGSFTGIRVGMSVAGALAWALDIPLNGKKIKDGKMPDIKYEK